MPDGNGQEQTGGDRLDRIEKALDLIVDDHILFRNEHKRLLAAQVVLTDQMDKVTERLNRLAGQVALLTEGQTTLMDQFRAFTAAVEQMRQDFDARLKRLEQ